MKTEILLALLVLMGALLSLTAAQNITSTSKPLRPANNSVKIPERQPINTDISLLQSQGERGGFIPLPLQAEPETINRAPAPSTPTPTTSTVRSITLPSAQQPAGPSTVQIAATTFRPVQAQNSSRASPKTARNSDTKVAPVYATASTAPVYGSAPPAPIYGFAPPQSVPKPAPSYGFAPPAPVYKAAPPAPAYGSAPPAPVYKAAPQAPAYGSAPPAPVYKAAPPAPAYGSAPPAPAYGSAPPAPAYGSAPPAPVYKAAPPAPAYGSAPAAPAYGADPPAPVYGSALSKPQVKVPVFKKKNKKHQRKPTPVQPVAAPVPSYGSAPPPPPAYGSPLADKPVYSPSYMAPAPQENSYTYYPVQSEEETGGFKQEIEGMKSAVLDKVKGFIGWLKGDELGIGDQDVVGYYKDGIWALFVPLIVIGVVLPVLFAVGAIQAVSFPVPAWVRALANFINSIFPIRVNVGGRSFDSSFLSSTGFHSEMEMEAVERAFNKYSSALYSDDCIEKLSCELGDSVKDSQYRNWMIWIAEKVIGKKYSRAKAAFVKTAQEDWTIDSCRLFKCKVPKLKDL